MKNSSRHHYIPEFLIKGFTDSENKVFIYDILKDEIKPKSKSPKSIFFEWNRNTFTTDKGEEISIIEDLLFKEWDNKAAPIIKKFQETTLPDPTLLSDNNIADFTLFLIQLFWRLPYTDYAADFLIQNAEIDSKISEELRKYEPFKMHQRSLLYRETLKTLENLKSKTKGFHAKIFELEKEIFLLGDNPIIFQQEPSTFDDLYDLDSITAISSQRIFTNSLLEIKSFDFKKALDYNYFVISRSKRYVCSGDKKLLEESVKYYKNISRLNIDNELLIKLFSTK